MSDSAKYDTVDYPQVDDLYRHFGPSPQPVQVTFGALSHPGLVRANNQDHYLVVKRSRNRSILLTNLPGEIVDREERVYVLAIADGMGGAASGDLASATALRNAFELGHSTLKWVFKVTEQEIHELKEQLEAILTLVHQGIRQRGLTDRKLAGMGTTLTGAYLIGLDALIAHIGDSRAYLFRTGTLHRLTRDHTLEQQMIDAGLHGGPPGTRHVLTNCLGGNEQEVHVEFNHVLLHNGDRLLFCTDGLIDMVAEPMIAATLSTHPDPQAACGALIDCALHAGGKDNVTAVVADFAVILPQPTSTVG
jgi:serine/threonine protein phosphatase PrpC